MNVKNPINRADPELRDILDEPGTWLIQGYGDRIFGIGGSLRRAIERANRFAESGAVVSAVVRVPPNRIFISHAQLVRLSKMVREEADLVSLPVIV